MSAYNSHRLPQGGTGDPFYQHQQGHNSNNTSASYSAHGPASEEYGMRDTYSSESNGNNDYRASLLSLFRRSSLAHALS